MDFRTFKANASRHVLALLAVGAILPFAARAEDAPIFIPASEWSVGATQLSNVRGLAGIKMPCVLSAEYDNGYVVRLSGGGGKLLAMAVDFRQNVFSKGRKYPVTLSAGTGYIKQAEATAFTSSTLIVNLRPLGDFYQAMQGAKTLGLDIEENSMTFDLGRIDGQYKALDACYAGKSTPVIEPMNGLSRDTAVPKVESAPVENIAPVPLSPVEDAAKEMPRTFDDIVKGADRQEVPPAQPQMKISQVTPRPPEPSPEPSTAQHTNPAPVAAPAMAQQTKPEPQKVARPKIVSPAAPTALVPAPKAAAKADEAQTVSRPVTDMPPMEAAARPGTISTPPVEAPPAKVWEALAGEDIKIVLSRWAERAGYDLQWQSDQDGKVAQDMKLGGSFEDAVTQLLAENSAASGISGHVESVGGARKTLAGSANSVPAVVSEPVQASIPAMNERWEAPAGTSLQMTLDQWAARAGVAVVWDDVVSLPVKKTVDVTGTFETAVQNLLDQYAAEKTRPVGSLNTDPDNGRRTLTISLDKSE